jgi:putative membrane protein
MQFLVHVLVTAGLLLVVAKFVDGFTISNGQVALISALVLGLANAVVRPVLVLLTLPLTMLTMGLFLIVINAIMLKLSSSIVSGFTIKGTLPAMLGALLLTGLNIAVAAMFGIG